ncbi:hypothetical protein [Bacillus cereus]|nr:hypothetical protein [Bacillus cereus]
MLKKNKCKRVATKKGETNEIKPKQEQEMISLLVKTMDEFLKE